MGDGVRQVRRPRAPVDRRLDLRPRCWSVKRCLSAVELSDGCCGCNQAEGVFEDLGDLVPINFGISWRVGEDPEPVPERPARRCRRLEEPCGCTENKPF